MTAYGPYTPIVSANNMLFISGQIGIDPKTNHVGQTVTEQTKQVLKNMETLLANEGAGLGDVVKTTVFLTDMSTFQEMNAVYENTFPAPRPARSTVGVKELPRLGDTPLLVEIEAIARKKEVA
ncbi:MAG: RidA family protein [Candidatus Saccharibacteria bacterium]|nr:MAG: RidA family protein [Candidatus Saccharibacteria bacterium]